MSLAPFLDPDIYLTGGGPRDDDGRHRTSNPIEERYPFAIYPRFKSRTRVEPLAAVVHLYTSTEHQLSSVVTQSPLDDGSVVNDHVSRRPTQLALAGVVSDLYPVPYVETGRRDAPPRQPFYEGRPNATFAYQRLRRMWLDSEVFGVATPWYYYREAVMEDCRAFQRGAWGSAMTFRLRVREVRRVSLNIQAIIADTTSGPAEGRESDSSANLARIAQLIDETASTLPPVPEAIYIGSFSPTSPGIPTGTTIKGPQRAVQGPSAPRNVTATNGHNAIYLRFRSATQAGVERQRQPNGEPYHLRSRIPSAIRWYEYNASVRTTADDPFEGSPWRRIPLSADGEAHSPKQNINGQLADVYGNFVIRDIFEPETEFGDGVRQLTGYFEEQLFAIRVRAINQDDEGVGETSSTVVARPLPSELKAPTNPRAIDIGGQKVSITWDRLLITRTEVRNQAELDAIGTNNNEINASNIDIVRVAEAFGIWGTNAILVWQPNTETWEQPDIYQRLPAPQYLPAFQTSEPAELPTGTWWWEYKFWPAEEDDNGIWVGIPRNAEPDFSITTALMDPAAKEAARPAVNVTVPAPGRYYFQIRPRDHLGPGGETQRLEIVVA